jgi:septation ring formation regulator EzrA
MDLLQILLKQPDIILAAWPTLLVSILGSGIVIWKFRRYIDDSQKRHLKEQCDALKEQNYALRENIANVHARYQLNEARHKFIKDTKDSLDDILGEIQHQLRRTNLQVVQQRYRMDERAIELDRLVKIGRMTGEQKHRELSRLQSEQDQLTTTLKRLGLDPTSDVSRVDIDITRTLERLNQALDPIVRYAHDMKDKFGN